MRYGAGRLTRDDFQGTERFLIRRRLGAGGMGVVYEALDRERGSTVALKTLRGLDAAGLYRLKREFRALADVSHPGLASLYELHSADQGWFFTMELVNGVDFLSWVRPGGAPPASDEPTAPSLERLRSAAPAPPGPASSGLDPDRLRDALRRLAEAVCVLHAAGRLHRDIKPSNVLVTPEGRVVLLDFGLVTELEGEVGQSTDQAIVGTAIYMAPEQAAGGAVTPACDWYAIGTMLYQSLTGRAPFSGSPLQVLMDKQRFEAPPPVELAREAPADLNALCVELLRREPARRPDGAEVLRRLGGQPRAVERRQHPRARFVGRRAELAALREAYEAARSGRGSIVFLRGRSGIGKSALARRFLDELSRSDEAVVLPGRCYERESVPFKALDSLIDALSRYLVRLPREKAEAVLPRDVGALSRMFPVLRRIDAVADAPNRPQPFADPQELRRRAFGALRELFQRMVDRRPLVLFIDDLQWGDLDSAALLAEVLRPPDPPALLLLACYRSEDAEPSRPLREMLAAAAPESRELAIEPLGAEESSELARALLGQEREARPADVEALARESGGNPFFMDALVRYVHDAGDRSRLEPPPGERGDISLEAVVRARTARLAEPARRLLQVVAVAGHPVPQAAAVSAAGLESNDAHALASLRSAHLLRAAPAGERDALETYHDRIRETVLAQLPGEEQAAIHLRLARALELGGADPESLAFHYGAAGQAERAAQHAAAAAVRAAEALAFERAALLFRRAIELEPAAAARVALTVQLGDALANAGRGEEAAQAYLSAAAASPAVPRAEVLELERRAAEQLLRSGHIDEGLEVIRGVLSKQRMRLAPTPRRALLALLARRAHLFLRGVGFRERDESQISPERLTRIDVCWSVAAGLAMVDTIRGASFQTKHLLLALAEGEPRRVARALAAEAAFVATGGRRARARAARLVSDAEALARRLNDPPLLGLVTFCDGMTEFLVGHWRRAREKTDAAERLFGEVGMGVAWEAASARLLALWSLFYLGELGELSSRLPRLLAEAQERGDLYAVASLRSGLANVAFLVADEPERARREVAEATGKWSRQGFHFQHYWGLLSNTMIDLYTGGGAACLERVTAAWPALERSLLLRAQGVRVEALYMRARAALAAAAAGGGERLRASALEDARRLESERLDWARALGQLLRAGVAAGRGDGGALAHFRAAERACEVAELSLFAAAAKRRAGELRGGEEGGAERDEADARMRKQRVRDPARMAAMLVP